MTLRRTPRPRDPIQLDKLMVDTATGAVPDAVEDGKDAVAIERGSKSPGGESRTRSAKSNRQESRRRYCSEPFCRLTRA